MRVRRSSLHSAIRRSKLAALGALLLISACSGERQLKDSIESERIVGLIQERNNGEKLDLPKLTSFSWDTLVVAKPYANVDALDVDFRTKSQLRHGAPLANEGVCTLVFLKGEKTVKLLQIPRNKVDFSQLRKPKYAANEAMFKTEKTSSTMIIAD